MSSLKDLQKKKKKKVNDYPLLTNKLKNPIFRNEKLIPKIIQILIVEIGMTSDKEKVL